MNIYRKPLIFPWRSWVFLQPNHWISGKRMMSLCFPLHHSQGFSRPFCMFLGLCYTAFAWFPHQAIKFQGRCRFILNWFPILLFSSMCFCKSCRNTTKTTHMRVSIIGGYPKMDGLKKTYFQKKTYLPIPPFQETTHMYYSIAFWCGKTGTNTPASIYRFHLKNIKLEERTEARASTVMF